MNYFWNGFEKRARGPWAKDLLKGVGKATLAGGAGGAALGAIGGGEQKSLDSNKRVKRSVGAVRGGGAGTGAAIGGMGGGLTGSVLGALAAVGLTALSKGKGKKNPRYVADMANLGTSVGIPAGAGLGALAGGMLGHKVTKKIGPKYDHEKDKK